MFLPWGVTEKDDDVHRIIKPRSCSNGTPAERRQLKLMYRSIWLPLILSNATIFLTSCSVRGAPSFTLFGAYFPAWMLCAAIGIVGAIGARIMFIGSGLADILPLQLLVCASLGLSIAMGTWLFWFGL